MYRLTTCAGPFPLFSHSSPPFSCPWTKCAVSGDRDRPPPPPPLLPSSLSVSPCPTSYCRLLHQHSRMTSTLIWSCLLLVSRRFDAGLQQEGRNNVFSIGSRIHDIHPSRPLFYRFDHPDVKTAPLLVLIFRKRNSTTQSLSRPSAVID